MCVCSNIWYSFMSDNKFGERREHHCEQSAAESYQFQLNNEPFKNDSWSGIGTGGIFYAATRPHKSVLTFAFLIQVFWPYKDAKFFHSGCFVYLRGPQYKISSQLGTPSHFKIRGERRLWKIFPVFLSSRGRNTWNFITCLVLETLKNRRCNTRTGGYFGVPCRKKKFTWENHNISTKQVAHTSFDLPQDKLAVKMFPRLETYCGRGKVACFIFIVT